MATADEMRDSTHEAIGILNVLQTAHHLIEDHQRIEIAINEIERLSEIEAAARSVAKLNMVMSPRGQFCNAECLDQCEHCKAKNRFVESLKASGSNG